MNKITLLLSLLLCSLPFAHAETRYATAESQAINPPVTQEAPLTTAESKLLALQKINKKLIRDLNNIRRTAADSIRIANERTKLRQNVAILTREVADLTQENQDLSNQSIRNWFLVGAGVIIVGILIGLLLPRLHIQRRKDTWRSL